MTQENKEYWKKPEVLKRKTEELKRRMRKVALPDVSKVSGIPLHLLEAYMAGRRKLSKKIYEKICNSLCYAENMAQVKNRDEETEEKEEERNTALIIRFSQKEWEKVSALCGGIYDLEAGLRSFLFYTLDDKELKGLYCPFNSKKLESEVRFLFEESGCKVAVELDVEGIENIERLRHQKGLNFDECTQRTFMGAYKRIFGSEEIDLKDADWRDTALYYKQKYESLLDDIKTLGVAE